MKQNGGWGADSNLKLIIWYGGWWWWWVKVRAANDPNGFNNQLIEIGMPTQSS